MDVYDSIVIGAGIEGLATGYHLAKQNHKTLILEQFLLPHTRGSSHGQTRIIRKAYTKQHYADIMDEVYSLWHCLEKETGKKLLYQTGLFTVASPPGKFVHNMESALLGKNRVYQKMAGDQINKLLPMVRFSSEDIGVLENEAGVLLAEKCLQCFQQMFTEYGGQLNDRECVEKIIPGHIIKVQTSKNKTYRTRSLIITAGPWTSKLLAPLDLRLPLTPQKVTVCYWRQIKTDYNIHQGFRPFIVETDDHYFGIPAFEYPEHVKICLHSGPNIDPDDRDVYPNQDIEKISAFIRKHFPGIEPKPSILESCIYTWTPDEDYILDRHPKYHNIVIGCGFSGHGFKMAPMVGKLLSQLATNKPPSADMRPYKISRFNKSKL